MFYKFPIIELGASFEIEVEYYLLNSDYIIAIKKSSALEDIQQAFPEGALGKTDCVAIILKDGSEMVAYGTIDEYNRIFKSVAF